MRRNAAAAIVWKSSFLKGETSSCKLQGMRPVARALVLTLGLGACRGDSRPPPPMTVIEPLPAAGRVEARPNGGVDAGWWSTPLGEEAVAARTRGDRAHTIAVLDRLLADDSLPERERPPSMYHSRGKRFSIK